MRETSIFRGSVSFLKFKDILKSVKILTYRLLAKYSSYQRNELAAKIKHHAKVWTAYKNVQIVPGFDFVF